MRTKVYKQGHGSCEVKDSHGSASYQVQMKDEEGGPPYPFNVCEGCLLYFEDEMHGEFTE